MKTILMTIVIIQLSIQQAFALTCADGSTPQLRTITLRDEVTGQYTYQTEEYCNDPILVSNTTTTTTVQTGLSANFSGQVAGGKQAAENQAKNMSTGKMLVYGASALAAARGVMCLPVTGPCPGQAPYWFAGAALGVLVGSQLGGGHKNRALQAAAALTDTAKTETVNNPGAVAVDQTTTEDTTDSNSDTGTATNQGTDSVVSGGNDSATQKSIQQTLNTLKANGYKVDANNGKVTTPDGKTIDLKKSGYNVQKALAAAGFSSSDSGKIMGNMAQAGEQAKADLAKGIDKNNASGEATGAAGAGGGGVGASGSAGIVDDNFGLASGNSASAAGKLSPQVAGLSKNYNGEKIGVANDSLFKMIERKYNLEESRGQFILRTPASVSPSNSQSP